jgi:hypothetical protein
MAELHESLVRAFRRRIIRKGLRETKSPMPTYRPDIFAEKLSRNGRVLEQVAVEAEIHSTLFSEHTSHQLLRMNEFIKLQRSKRIQVRGFLVVPKAKNARAHADGILDSLFPEGTAIRVVESI